MGGRLRREGTYAQRIDHLTLRLTSALQDCSVRAETRLARIENRLLPTLKDSVAQAERRLAESRAKLSLLDPANPLKRGYSLTFDGAGRILRHVADVASGDTLTTRLGDGELVSVVR